MPARFGDAGTSERAVPWGSGFLTNVTSTPSSMPSDHAVTSYGASGGAVGTRRTSGYVCFSRRSFAYREKTCVIGTTNVPAG